MSWEQSNVVGPEVFTAHVEFLPRPSITRDHPVVQCRAAKDLCRDGMELAWIEDFLVLAECGGFSRAADRRHVTQPAFSRRIRALARWVGAELIDRSSHRIGLTAAGLAFRPTAEELRRRLQEGREQAREAAREASGSVRLACTHMLASTYFPGWLAAVETRLGQDVAFQLSVDNMLACERLMRGGEVQLLLCHHHEATPTELDAHPFTRLCLERDRLVPVSTPDSQGQPLHPVPREAGQAAPYLAYREESGLGRILRCSGVLARLRGRLDPAFHSHAALTLANLARSGRGVAWTPLSLVQSDLDRNALVQAGSADMSIDIAVCLIRPVTRQNPVIESLWSLTQAKVQATSS